MPAIDILTAGSRRSQPSMAEDLPPMEPLSRDELAIRLIPLRALFELEVLARCDGRLVLAAKRIGISGAALSTQITRLEAMLGADVLRAAKGDRGTFELTEFGESLFERLRDLLPELKTLSLTIQHGDNSSERRKRRRDQKRPSEPCNES